MDLIKKNFDDNGDLGIGDWANSPIPIYILTKI